MIYVLATSLSGSQHIATGGVKDRANYLWRTREEAQSHLDRIGWTDVQFATGVKEIGEEIFVTWENQAKTRHIRGSGSFEYLRGAPLLGGKISKSERTP